MTLPAILALLAAAPASPPPDTLPWRGTVRYGVEVFTRERSAWETLAAAVSRRFGRHAVVVEASAVERFDQRDPAVTAEAYLAIGGRTALYLRGTLSPGADVLARSDLAGEFTRGVGAGFELSLGYRRMDFPTDPVDLVLGGAAWYLGWWYLRLRATLVPTGGTTGFAGALSARRYLGHLEDFVEVSAGTGKEVVLLDRGPAVDLRRIGFLAARAEARLGPRWGVAAGFSWNAERGLPSRGGGSLGLTARW